MCFTGKNRVMLTAYDQRRYAFGVQLARKRSQAEVRFPLQPTYPRHQVQMWSSELQTP
jgi:hypothetical protein